MHNPPLYFLLVVLVLTSGMISLIFFIAWKNFVREPHTLSWSIAFFCAMCQWLLTAAQPMFPSFEAFWLTARAFSLGLIVYGLRGHFERARPYNRPRRLWPYAVAAFVIMFWTLFVQPHAGIATAILPAVAAAALFLSAHLVLSRQETVQPAERAAATMMILFGTTQTLSTAIALMQGATRDPRYWDLFLNFNIVTLPAGYIGVAMFTIFMLASDMSEKMKQIAVMDQLTGLLNRRGFGEQAVKAYATARRTSRPVSVVMTDIDLFKDINDEFGHAVGDLALQHFSAILGERRRTEDIIARMGGEEFALVLPGTQLDDACKLAEALCAEVHEKPMEVDGRNLSMTASFGVSTLGEHDTCLTDVVARADRALYRSKRLGRNRVDVEMARPADKSKAELESAAAG